MAREIDDVYKRQKYKKEQYGDKKSRRDDYTGERVFIGNDRNSQYKHPTSKTSDTDHITPIGVVEERYKRLTKEQQRVLVNNEKHNYATTNSKLNRSKKDLENHEYLIRQMKNGEPESLKTSATMLAKEVHSRSNMAVEATGMYAENFQSNAKELVKSSINMVADSGGKFVTGATDTLVASAIPLTSEAVRKLVKVAQGEESLSDAAKDMGKLAVNIAVSGEIKDMFLGNIANSNGTAQIIAVASLVQESALKYINGEIDGNEFIEEVGEKGAVWVSGMIGGTVGKEIGSIIGFAVGTAVMPGAGTALGYIGGEVIGEVLGAIITTVACSTIVLAYNTLEDMNNYKLKENQIRRLESGAILEMSNQREKLKSIMEREYNFWDEKIQSGFDMLLRGACEQTFNLQGVTDGLDKILGVFGKSVAFKDLDEYEAQLGDTLILNFGRG